MKSFIIIFVLIVSTECGLLDDLVSLKDEKPKSGTESNRPEYRQGVLIKVRETLKNGTKVVIDALGNVIRISPKENEDNTNSKGTQGSPKGTEEVTKKYEEVDKPDSKNDLPTSTEKMNVEAPKTDENKNKTLPTEVDKPDSKNDLPTSTEKVTVETPKTDKNQNKTLPTNGETKDLEESANREKETMKNTTDSSKPDGNTGGNCTSTDEKGCDTVGTATRTSFKGDECPTGKSRADDGTCVEVV